MRQLPPGSEEARLGTAVWADPDWLADRHGYEPGKLWLGRLPDGTPVGHADDRHVCLVSGSRGGKGTTSIVPNLCLWPGSVVVIDPKGENATITATRRGRGSDGCEGMDQAVHVLDPFRVADVDESLRARFNPLDALSPDSDESVDEAARLADALVAMRPETTDPFWDESARAMIKGLILHVLTAERFEGRRNLVTVREFITRGDWRALDVLREAGEENLPSAQELMWREVQANQAFDGIVASFGDTFAGMLVSAPKQYESVLQVANRNTEFLDSPAMRACVEVSDFDIASLKTQPAGVSVYLCLPQRYMNTHYRWLRMLVTLTITEMEKVRGRPAAGAPVLLVLDEFAGLRRMEIIETAVAQIAGFGVKLFFVLQTLEQLKAIYKDNWETFLSNSGLKIFFAVEDHFSRDYVSKLIGETEVRREVRSSSDSRSMSESESESVSDSVSESVTESVSESTGESQSRGQSVTRGRNRSLSRGESSGSNDSVSTSRGASSSMSYRYRTLFGRPEDRYSDGANWSSSRSHGTSHGTSVTSSTGTSESESDSHTSGSSQTHGRTSGTSRSTTRGTTHGTTRGTTQGRTEGASETVHKRFLISPDEIGRLFARIDDPADPAYPGFALALVAGAAPAPVLRTNYFDDPAFIGYFDPHPDHEPRAVVTVRIPSAPIREARAVWPNLAFAPMVGPGEPVWRGSDLALAVNGSLEDEGVQRWPIEAPVSGRVVAQQYLGPADELPDVVAEILCYAGEEPLDPYGAMERILQEELERRRQAEEEAAMKLAMEFTFIEALKDIGKTRARWAAVALLCAAAVLMMLFLNAPTRGFVVVPLAGLVYGVRRFRWDSRRVAQIAAGFKKRGSTTQGLERLDLSSQAVPLLAGACGLLLVAVLVSSRGAAEAQGGPAGAGAPAMAAPVNESQAGTASVAGGAAALPARRWGIREATPPASASSGATAALAPTGTPAGNTKATIGLLAAADDGVAAAGAGPSFSCAGQINPIESLICRDEGLATLDRSLAAVYARAFQAGMDAAKLQADQRQWMASRNECQDKFLERLCVESSYKYRIARLQVESGAVSETTRSAYSCSGGPTPLTVTVIFYLATDPEAAVVGVGPDRRLTFLLGNAYTGTDVKFGPITMNESTLVWDNVKYDCAARD